MVFSLFWRRLGSQNHPQHKPVLIRNGKRVICSKLPAASCCVWRVIAPLASLAALARSLRSRNLKNIFQNLSNSLPRWPPTPPKINAKTLQKSGLERHFGRPGRVWRHLGPSWAPLGASWRPLGRHLGPSWAVLGAS